MDRLGDEASALRRLAGLIRENRAEARRLTATRRSLIAHLHREDAGFTQERLADLAQVSQPYIHRVLREATDHPVRPDRHDELAVTKRERLADLGRRLRIARERRGISAASLAASASLTEADVNTVEAGGEILLGDLLAIVAALGRADWIRDLESLEPTPNERLAAIQAGHPLPIDEGSWSAYELRQR